MISIRHKYPAIARGTYNAVSCGEKNLGGFYIEYEGDTIGLFHNNSTEELSFDLGDCKGLDGNTFKTVCDFIGTGSAKIEGTVVTVGPQTSVILK